MRTVHNSFLMGPAFHNPLKPLAESPSETNLQASPRKKSNKLTKFFKRHAKSNSDSGSASTFTASLSDEKGMRKSQSSRFSYKRSMESSNSTSSNKRMIKSQSVPNGLLSNSKNNRELTIQSANIDISKVKLPNVHSIKNVRSEAEELEAARRKLLGNRHIKSLRRKHRPNYNDNSNINGNRDGVDDSDSDMLSDPESSSQHKQSISKLQTSQRTDTRTTAGESSITEGEHDSIRPKTQLALINHGANQLAKAPHLSNTNLRLHSSTPNPSDSSINGDANGDNNPSNDSKEHTGIFSSLLNTLNWKSFTDLTGVHDENHNEAENHNDLISKNSHVSLDAENGRHSEDKRGDSPLDKVSFVPIKQPLIKTLGQGSLTLDAFPKNQTQLLNQDDTTRILVNGQPADTLNYKKASPTRPRLEITREDRERRVRNSMSPSRKQQMRASLSSMLSSDEDEGAVGSIPMSASMKLKKRLKLPLSSKKIMTDSAFSTMTDEYPDVSPRKRISLIEKLDVRMPSEKRQEAFHSAFPGLPSDEILIEDFTCAYRKDILIQGKLYLTDQHVCFYSNILGLVTRIIIPLNSILKIQKKKTVGIPNAIEFSNLHDKFVFASFLSRDPTFDLINKVWKLTINNEGYDTISMDFDDDDEVESIESLSGDSSYVDDTDFGGDHAPTYPVTRKSTSGSGDVTTAAPESNGTGTVVANNDDTDTSISDPENMVKDDGNDEKTANENIFNGLPFEGPKAHPETSNGYTPESSDVKIIDDVINAPLGLVYGLLFGDDVSFVQNLLKVQKNFDISDIPKFSGNKRNYSYVKPLNAPVGPKQTRCLVEEDIEHKDFNKYCLVIQLTDSPDVPSGNNFKVKTKIYLSWAANNATKIFIVTSIVWSGKSWIKGAIEKGTISGQKESLGQLVTELKKKISAGGTATAVGKSKKRDRKKEKEGNAEETLTETSVEPVSQPVVEMPPEPKSYLDIIKEQIDLKFILIFILFTIVLSDKVRKPSKPAGGYELYSNDRMLMSESSLWEWIEERERVTDRTLHRNNDEHRKQFRQSLGGRARDKMSDLELKATIEMLEQQLSSLKEEANHDIL